MEVTLALDLKSFFPIALPGSARTGGVDDFGGDSIMDETEQCPII